MQASGFPPSLWRASSTRFACATSKASVRTLPLAAIFTVALCLSQTALLVGESTQLPNTSVLHTRKPASVTSGSQLRWYRPSRFVYQHAQPVLRAHCSPNQHRCQEELRGITCYVSW